MRMKYTNSFNLNCRCLKNKYEWNTCNLILIQFINTLNEWKTLQNCSNTVINYYLCKPHFRNLWNSNTEFGILYMLE